VPGLDDDARLLAVPALAAGRPVVLVVGATLGDRADALQELLTLYSLIGPAALAISSLIGWGLAGAALRPVGLMTRRAADLRRDQRVHGRLPVPPTGDELTRLAVTLNDMLDGLEELLDRERRFVDRASHEIRTPLAILKARIDVATSRSRTAEELSLILAGVGRDTDRIVRLAEDLLVLARTRPEGLPVRLEDVELPEFLASVAAPFAARADGEGRRVSVDAETVTARLDAARLRQAVENLLENALRHGQGGVQVTARALDGLLRIDVTDEGGGFGDDVLAHAFEPFRRGRHGPGEGARHGAGLGLAVVLAVAQAHGGTATARNLPGRGAGVRLDVPLSGRI
jgi:two-component system, OmpR family, sensor kinase